jgi:hypothetical protein
LIQKSQVYVFRESSNIVEFENKFYLNLNFVFKFKAATENSKKSFFHFPSRGPGQFQPKRQPWPAFLFFFSPLPVQSPSSSSLGHQRRRP